MVFPWQEAHLARARDLFDQLGASPDGGITYLMLQDRALSFIFVASSVRKPLWSIKRQEKLHTPQVRHYFESLGHLSSIWFQGHWLFEQLFWAGRHRNTWWRQVKMVSGLYASSKSLSVRF